MTYSLGWIGQARPQEALNALLGSQAVPPPNPYEPLPFYFSGQSALDRFIAERDKMLDANRELVERAHVYYLLDLPTLRETFTQLKSLSFDIDAIRPYSLGTSYPTQTYFDDLLTEMEARLASLVCPLWEPVYSSFSFEKDVLFRKGTPLTPLPYSAPCDFTKDSIKLFFFQEIYHFTWSYSYEEEDLRDEEFIEWFEEEACTDWSKQDVQGEPYGSASWRAEEDDAYETTRKENMEALMALPFPRQFLIWTARYGCHNRFECVAYSASLGYLFQKLLKRFQFILGWAVLKAWRPYKQRKAARFISLALWFAYYKSEGFYPNRVLPFKQLILSNQSH